MSLAITSQHRAVQWAILAVLSIGLYAVMAWLHMPAALLLASMGAGILTSSRSFSIRVHLPNG